MTTAVKGHKLGPIFGPSDELRHASCECGVGFEAFSNMAFEEAHADHLVDVLAEDPHVGIARARDALAAAVERKQVS